MTKTLTKHLQEIKASGKGIFVPYIMAGGHDKGLDGLFEMIDLLENSGASAIEVGIPWSDPVADEPVIELAGQRSLAKGVNLTGIVEKLQEKTVEVPLVIMTYINLVYQYGIEKFVKDLAGTSVKGLIIPDLPHEHENLIKLYLDNTDIALVPLVSLTTGIERQKKPFVKTLKASSMRLLSTVLQVKLVITEMIWINIWQILKLLLTFQY